MIEQLNSALSQMLSASRKEELGFRLLDSCVFSLPVERMFYSVNLDCILGTMSGGQDLGIISSHGELLQTFRFNGILSLEGSPTSSLLAVSGASCVSLLNLAGGECHCLDPSPGISASAFSPDGGTLALGDYGGLVRIWNLATPRRVIWDLQLQSRSAIQSLAFSADGGHLAALSLDSIEIWDRWTGTLLSRQVVQAQKIVFGKTGDLFFASGTRLYRWSCLLDFQAPVQPIPPAIFRLEELKSNILSLEASPCGRYLGVGFADKTFSIVDLQKNGAWHRSASEFGARSLFFLSKDDKSMQSDSSNGLLKVGVGGAKGVNYWAIDP